MEEEKKFNKLLHIVKYICNYKETTLLKEVEKVILNTEYEINEDECSTIGFNVSSDYEELCEEEIISLSAILTIQNILVYIKDISIDGYGNVVCLKTNKLICKWDLKKKCLIDQKLSVINAICDLFI